ncbi:MAG: ABC transporter permease [Planctomycetes bacterium]|nr:ABC transporter permease [Planctomycetota bacterium]
MTPSTRLRQIRRATFRFYLRSHLAVIASVAVAAAALGGALIVGDSMRGSLRDQALAGLGPIQHALQAPRFFRADLLQQKPTTSEARKNGCAPIVQLAGAIEHLPSGLRVRSVNVIGCDDRFGKLDSTPSHAAIQVSDGVVLNKGLADQFRARVGDEVDVFIERSQLVPLDMLLGRRDDIGASIRLKITAIVAGDGLSNFALRPSVRTPRNAFVPLERLQKAIRRADRVNTLVTSDGDSSHLSTALKRNLSAADLDFRVRTDASGGCIVVESDRLLIEPSLEQAILDVVIDTKARQVSVLSYLINSIERIRDGAATSTGVPYSTGCAMDAPTGLTLLDNSPAPTLGPDDVLLNEWTATDLGAKIGDRIKLTYYVSRPMGRLETQTTDLTLRGIVRMAGLGADPGLTPTYEGITNTRRLTDWDPPFPMDMKRIRPKDEAYWDEYKATPKVFVSRETGLRLWSESNSRYGRYTSIRITPPAGTDIAAFAKQFEADLLKRINPEQFGMVFRPVRDEALAASKGSTDFDGLFLGFSSFLIIAAAMLVALLFRLGIERRATQIGLLLALGWNTRRVRSLLIREGLGVAVVGVLLGMGASVIYAALMINGLRTWWADAVTIPNLSLHVTPITISNGICSSLAVIVATMLISIRGLTRYSPRRLMSGMAASEQPTADSNPGRAILAAIALAVLAFGALLAPRYTEALPVAIAFFIGGALLLASSIAAIFAWFKRRHASVVIHRGRLALARLGLRNAARHRGRSVLTVSLVACAAFVIIAVGANRHGIPENARAKTGGTGGYRLIGESAVPIAYDLNSKEGRDAIGLSKNALAAMEGVTISSFRLRPGDDTSCLNLYQAREPRILGASDAFIARGGFTFADLLDGSAEEAGNPWLLLNRSFPDGAIPCIGDANTVQWLLHLGIGKDLSITNERGEKVNLRIVATLAGSILQGELVIAETQFTRQFPSIAGYRVFLIDDSHRKTEGIEGNLQRDLKNFGMEVSAARRRLIEYMAIENTYLSAFQTLGGLGLVLGTLGLAAVMLRNLLERRGELALLASLGFSRGALEKLVLMENAALLLYGLSAGTVSAALAVAPNAMARSTRLPLQSLGLTLGAVLAVGLCAIVAAMRSALRGRLIESLRRE